MYIRHLYYPACPGDIPYFSEIREATANEAPELIKFIREVSPDKTQVYENPELILYPM
ncbi:MAG: hypothetical protein M1496_00675 [Candidatus Thermoplasmatota archaeon]|jgi:hypothetical protein|nr:hypothetical protein [Candidatus Thermoplasmatota archaeon]